MNTDDLNHDKFDLDESNFIDDEIDNIVKKGVKPKTSYFGFLKNMMNVLGFRVIFHDAFELLILVLILAIASLMITITVNRINIVDTSTYKLLYCVAPLIFLGASISTFVSAKQSKTFEIEATCKYSIYQIAAFRMFIFSIINALVNVVLILILFCIDSKIDLIRGWTVSISSIFIFSSVLLCLLIKIKNKVIKHIFLTCWILFNILIAFFDNKIINYMFVEVPIVVHIGIAAVSTIIYIKNLKKLIYLRSKKGEI